MLLLVIDETEKVVKFRISRVSLEVWNHYRKLRDLASCIEEQGYTFCPRSSWKEFREKMESLGFQVQGKTEGNSSPVGVETAEDYYNRSLREARRDPSSEYYIRSQD